jgi:Uma2 family endonuclease
MEYWVVNVSQSRIHVMSESDGKHFQKIEIFAPPQILSPKCLPHAKLVTSDLFLESVE